MFTPKEKSILFCNKIDIKQVEELWGLTAFKIHFSESSNLFWNVQKWAIWWNLVAAAEQESLKLKFASCSQYKIVSVLNLKNNNIILVAVCTDLHAFVSRMLLIIPSIISMYLIRRTWMCTWNLNSRILFTCRRYLLRRFWPNNCSRYFYTISDVKYRNTLFTVCAT